MRTVLEIHIIDQMTKKLDFLFFGKKVSLDAVHTFHGITR